MEKITEKQIVKNLNPEIVESVKIGGKVYPLYFEGGDYCVDVYFHNGRPCFRMSYDSVFSIVYLDNGELGVATNDDIEFSTKDFSLSIKKIYEIIKNNS